MGSLVHTSELVSRGASILVRGLILEAPTRSDNQGVSDMSWEMTRRAAH